jgi:non-ribosomal peptide synthetase component F
LQELPLQYGDYARWQRRWLRGPVLDAHLDYWRRRLEDAPPPLELPTDRPRPVEATHRGATRRVVLPAALSEDLRTLSRQEGVTLFMTLLAGFQALLSLRTGHTDVVVGTDVANRNAAECEALIGFFVNQLVLRTDLAGDPTFRTLLGRVREVALGAYDHQDLPFDDLVKALRPDRDLGRHPLFHVKFVLQNAPSPEMELDGLVLHPLPLDRGTAKFDLLLDLEDTGAALAGRIEYSTDLFDEGTVVGLFEQWHRLLAAAARRPGARLSELGQSLEAEVAQARAEMGRRLGEVGVARLRTARRRQATGIAP